MQDHDQLPGIVVAIQKRISHVAPPLLLFLKAILSLCFAEALFAFWFIYTTVLPYDHNVASLLWAFGPEICLAVYCGLLVICSCVNLCRRNLVC